MSGWVEPKYSGYDGPPIDHGILSPSGKLSKRTKAHVIAKHQAEAQRWWDKKYPPTNIRAEVKSETEEKARKLDAIMQICKI